MIHEIYFSRVFLLPVQDVRFESCDYCSEFRSVKGRVEVDFGLNGSFSFFRFGIFGVYFGKS